MLSKEAVKKYVNQKNPEMQRKTMTFQEKAKVLCGDGPFIYRQIGTEGMNRLTAYTAFQVMYNEDFEIVDMQVKSN